MYTVHVPSIERPAFYHLAIYNVFSSLSIALQSTAFNITIPYLIVYERDIFVYEVRTF